MLQLIVSKPEPCPNIGIYGYRCSLCEEFHYPAWQLELYETCDVCGAIVFGSTTGLRRPHKACRIAINRWIRDDNVEYLKQLDQQRDTRITQEPSP